MRMLGLTLYLAATRSTPSAAQIAEYGPAQLARQAVAIRAPYLARMARVSHAATSSKPGAARKKVEWDPQAPLGAGFAREEAQRRALTSLFTACLDTYEARAKAEGFATDDLAVTYGHTIALNAELATGSRLSAPEEAALRQRLRDGFASSPLYWTDADKRSVHETLVITTMLAVAGPANAVRDNDPAAQAMFRDAGARNVTALTGASLVELRNARSASAQPR